MGKKIVTLNQASLKISKHQKKHQQQQKQQQQQQFSSLIKVLRPRVYITDTSCFKKLVQELTGNGTTTREHDDDHHLLRHESAKKAIAGPEIEDHHHRDHHGGDDSSDQYLSNQTSSPMSSSDGVSNRQVFNEMYSFEEGLLTLEHSTSNGDPMFDSLSPSGASVYSKSPSFSCEDLESWLLDMEMLPAAPFCNGLSRLEPEVSIYDYELSGLL